MRRIRFFIGVCIGVASIGAFLYVWTVSVEGAAHYTPDYPKRSLDKILDKELLTGEDYDILFRQTGLGKVAVDAIRRSGRSHEIKMVQEIYFEPVRVCCEANSLISREERVVCDGRDVQTMIPVVEEGDILITFNSHAFGWRCGHAAIVVDAEKRLTLEARVLGTDSAIMSMSHWQQYPSFAILRLKGVSKEERKKVADYAMKNLTDVPYQLTAGFFGDELVGTQCAHLVWYAYKSVAYDLDSDGGRLVTPKDLFESEYLEIVQLYGMKES